MHAPSELQRSTVAARLRSPGMMAVYAAVLLIAWYLVLRAPGVFFRPVASNWDPLVLSLFDWTILAALLAVLSARAGLLLLVAIGPFDDPVLLRQVFVGDFNISDDVRAKSVIAICLLLGVVVRVVVQAIARRSRPATAPVADHLPGSQSAVARTTADDDATAVYPLDSQVPGTTIEAPGALSTAAAVDLPGPSSTVDGLGLPVDGLGEPAAGLGEPAAGLVGPSVAGLSAEPTAAADLRSETSADPPGPSAADTGVQHRPPSGSAQAATLGDPMVRTEPGVADAPAAVERPASPTPRLVDRLGRLADPGIALGLAAILVLGTGLSLFAVSVAIDPTFGRQAIGVWLGGILTPFVALFVAAWLARRGDRSTVVAVVVVALVAGVIGVIAHLAKGTFGGTALAWMIEQGVPGERRLNGVVGLPNAAAAMLLAPIAILGAMVGRDVIRIVRRVPGLGRVVDRLVDRPDAWNDDAPRDPRIRWVAGACAFAAAGILALTFSRSALAAVLVIAVIIAWRQGRKLAMTLILMGLVAGVLVIPRFVAQRGDAGAAVGKNGETGLLTKGDSDRVRAWKAAVLMWEDAPIAGHGFYTYKLLHRQYGEKRVTAPHNEWLRLFAEEGTVVGLAGVGFVVFGFLALARVRGWLATGILAVFVGYVLMASFNNPLTYSQVGLMVLPVVGVGLGLAWAARAGPVPLAASVSVKNRDQARISRPAPA